MSKKTIAVLALIAGLNLSSVALAAEPDLEAAKALIQAGKYGEAYTLLEPFEFEKSGNLTFDYLLGTAALNSGNPSKATFIFERILAQEPNYVGVRLDMGRAYYEMGDYARAKIEFETIIVFENLPPDLRSAAGQYLAAIQQFEESKKTAWSSYVELGMGHNSNINSGVNQNPITSPFGTYSFDPAATPPVLKTASRYAGFAAGTEVNRLLTDRISLYAGVDAAARGNATTSYFNYQMLNGRAGLNIRNAPWLFSFGLVGGRNFSRGAASFDTAGGNLEVRYLANNSNQLSANGQVARLRFIDQTLIANDYDQATLGVGWLHAFSSGATALTVNASAGSEQAPNGRADGGKRFQGARIGLQSALAEKVGVFFSTGFQLSRYDQQNATFLVNRRDTLHDLSMGLTWEFAKAWSLRPQLVYLRNISNIPFNAYNGVDVSLNMRRSF